MKFSIVQIYYLVTPVFFILQYYFDINLRLKIPGGSENIIFIYYAVCFLASFVVFKNVFTASLFTLVESSINILLLLLSVMLPIISLGGNVLDAPNIKFGASEVIQFLIVGSVLIKGFYMNPLILGKHEN